MHPKLLALVALVLAAACAPASGGPATPSPAGIPSEVGAEPTVDALLESLSPRDRIAQLVVPYIPGTYAAYDDAAFARMQAWVDSLHVGGLIVSVGSPLDIAAKLNRLQQRSQIPLLVTSDLEGGTSIRLVGGTFLPPNMGIGATGSDSFAYEMGRITALEGRAIGIHLAFAPDADVNNNPDNPIINIRSFGENPQDVAAHVRAFIEGAHADKKNFVLTTVKHFPGHGDTATDTHMNLASIPADKERLENLELVPFKAAIAGGVDSVMTAHIAVPALAPPDLPATLSTAILTDLLRKDLGFKGLVVTDALEMGGIAKGFGVGDAAVRALEAGADTLLMPSDPDAAIRAVVSAVESGRISRQRLQESVARILTAKERVGLDKKRFVDLEAIGEAVDDPEANLKAQEVANRAVTLARNSGNLVPLAAPEHACYVVIAEGHTSIGGQAFAQEVRKRAPHAPLATIDPSMSPQDLEDSIHRLQPCDSYAVAAFASVGAFRGSVGLAGDLPRAVEMMAASGKPVALVALGNPYLLRNFPNVAAYLATYSTVPPSEVAAVKALWGEIAITGHLPVSIPGQAKYGEGIQMKATRAASPGSAPQ